MLVSMLIHLILGFRRVVSDQGHNFLLNHLLGLSLSQCANLCHDCHSCRAWKIVSASSVSALFMQTSKTQLYTEASTYSTCTARYSKYMGVLGKQAPQEPRLQDEKAWKSMEKQLHKHPKSHEAPITMSAADSLLLQVTQKTNSTGNIMFLTCIW